MKSLTANFTTEKDKTRGAKPKILLEIVTDSGTLYYSDQPVIVDAQQYLAKILNLGALKNVIKEIL